MSGNVIIGQSGGPTAVINQSLVGCVEALRAHGHSGRVLGARHGVRGVVEESFVDLGDLNADQLEEIARTPSAALGSSRDKPDEEYCANILRVLEKQQVRYFFYIGGNDSSDTCRIVNDLAQSSGYELHAIHVPKTVDNDLMESDHTPGFPSAARFVAHAFLGDNLDNRALPGVKINVIMGRHAGFLTAASALARRQEGDGPHLIYLPELPFHVDAFVDDVARMREKHGRCVVAVSEGIHDAEGTPIVTKLANTERDAHGNVQLSGTGALGDHLAATLKAELGAKLRVRADTFGYLQRCFPGLVSEVDAAEARRAGKEAVRAALAGTKSGSIAIKVPSRSPYRAELALVPLEAVAAKTRTMPPEYIRGTNDVTNAFLEYAAPLVGPLPLTRTL